MSTPAKKLPAFTNGAVEIVSSKPTVSFELDGARYHVWLNEKPQGGFDIEPSIGTKKPTLYKRPPANIKKGNKGYYQPRHLDASKGRWREIVAAIATPDAIAAAWAESRRIQSARADAMDAAHKASTVAGPHKPEPSRFYLIPYEGERPLAPGVEMEAFLKTSGDTVGIAKFMYPRGIELWRLNTRLAEANVDGDTGKDARGKISDIWELYRFAERHGGDW